MPEIRLNRTRVGSLIRPCFTSCPPSSPVRVKWMFEGCPFVRYRYGKVDKPVQSWIVVPPNYELVFNTIDFYSLPKQIVGHHRMKR